MREMILDGPNMFRQSTFKAELRLPQGKKKSFLGTANSVYDDCTPVSRLSDLLGPSHSCMRQ